MVSSLKVLKNLIITKLIKELRYLKKLIKNKINLIFGINKTKKQQMVSWFSWSYNYLNYNHYYCFTCSSLNVLGDKIVL